MYLERFLNRLANCANAEKITWDCSGAVRSFLPSLTEWRTNNPPMLKQTTLVLLTFAVLGPVMEDDFDTLERI